VSVARGYADELMRIEKSGSQNENIKSRSPLINVAVL
jgi:hypothetical protein